MATNSPSRTSTSTRYEPFTLMVKPTGMEKTEAGYATGSLDNDRLVIETTTLAAVIGGLSRNAPASNARTVTEQY